jgi:hypothetical protein
VHDEANKTPKQDAKRKRDARLHEALRANLSKRKQQNRSRATDPADGQADAPASSPPDGDEG